MDDKLEDYLDGGTLTAANLEEMRANPEVRAKLAHLVQSLQLDKTVVSVGSGNGVMEALAREFSVAAGKQNTPEIIAVDPFPNQYCPASAEVWNNFSVKPVYGTVSELLLTRSALVGRCVLWLLWPPYFLEFDVEALVLLQPTHVVVLTDLMGTACSPAFNRWLSVKCGVPARWKNLNLSGASHLSVRECGVRSFCRLGITLIGEVIPGNEIGPIAATVRITSQNRMLASLYLVDERIQVNKKRNVEAKARISIDFPKHLELMFCNGLTQQCMVCQTLTLLQCKGCALAHYCSAKCQRTDWKTHKPYCKYSLI